MNIKKKILYVEDEPVARDIVRRFVDKFYEIDFAENGEAALTMAKKNNYDCFLMDIGLKGKLNGIEATKKLKEINRNKNKPFIAVTAYAMPNEREAMMSGGLTHYIAKPFERRKLLELLNSALNL